MAPFEVALLVIGLVLGPFLNFAIYAFAYFPRAISPWQTPPIEIGKRSVWTKLPIVGWLLRGSEQKIFGRIFWLRPLLIEIATPIALIWLYRSTMAGDFVPIGGGVTNPSTLFHQFVAAALLISLMVVATFIDFDERTIPDMVTIPGTLIALLGGVLWPDWRLSDSIPPKFPALTGTLIPLHANSPMDWEPTWSNDSGSLTSIWVGCLVWTVWCFAMADRRWIDRRGVRKAFIYFVEVLRRSPSTIGLSILWVVGIVGLWIAFFSLPTDRWESLFSSLVGMGLGGLLVWGFRLVARWAMQQEALGFGDVTLMAMIGAFFGWQVVWMAFFTAPFFGLVFVIIGWLVTRDRSTPFGPYLCAATLAIMLSWGQVWPAVSFWFLPPGLILPVLVGLLIALGAMLWIVEAIKYLVLGPGETSKR